MPYERYRVYFKIHLRSTLRPRAPKEFENGGLFLRLGLPQSFSKTSFKLEESENAGFSYLCLFVFVSEEKKSFENKAFQKRWRHDNYMISLTEVSSNENSK